MKRFAVLGLLLVTPFFASAATMMQERTLVLSEAPHGNAYLVGADVTVTAAAPADLIAAGGSVLVSGTVGSDAALVGGTIDVRSPVAGDLRTVGGKVTVDSVVGGDLVALGGTILVTGKAKDLWVLGGTVNVKNGTTGTATIYGSTVTLAGAFSGDVRVVASNTVTVEDDTTIAGVLRYDAPQEADIASSAHIAGGVEYTGQSYLPTAAEARTFAVAGAGVFVLIKMLAALIAVGLLAGLFSRFAQAVADRALSHTPLRFILLTLLGFAVVVATPVLCFLLFISFAGIGVALLISAAYVFLMMLSFLCSGVIAGAALARGIVKREHLYWRDAVIGMFVLYLVSSIPVLGWMVILILFAAAAGVTTSLFYRFAFRHEEETELLPLE